jgi:hypothetical protein
MHPTTAIEEKTTTTTTTFCANAQPNPNDGNDELGSSLFFLIQTKKKSLFKIWQQDVNRAVYSV